MMDVSTRLEKFMDTSIKTIEADTEFKARSLDMSVIVLFIIISLFSEIAFLGPWTVGICAWLFLKWVRSVVTKVTIMNKFDNEHISIQGEIAEIENKLRGSSVPQAAKQRA